MYELQPAPKHRICVGQQKVEAAVREKRLRRRAANVGSLTTR